MATIKEKRFVNLFAKAMNKKGFKKKLRKTYKDVQIEQKKYTTLSQFLLNNLK